MIIRRAIDNIVAIMQYLQKPKKETKHMRFLKTAVLLLGVVSASPVYAEVDSRSGSYFLSGCNRFVAQGSNDYEYPSLFNSGICAGAVEVLLSWGATSHFLCVPDGVTKGQAARVIIKYINEHPERQHEYYVSLSVDALMQAWPCSKK